MSDETKDNQINQSHIQIITSPADTWTHDLLDRNVAVYCGFDPTARSLHLGNLMALISLVHFSISGHPVIALVGGATVRIGDPSWRSTAKDRLSESVLDLNVRSLMNQIETFLTKSHDYISTLRPIEARHQPKIVNQWEWYEGLGLIQFLEEVGSKMRVSSMISRDSVKARMQSENGLSFAELSYQLMQAYDFLHLNRTMNCQLQIGGSDQWGNIISGIDLIHRVDSSRVAHGLTLPLLTTGSGGEKMGKSAGNAKWLDRSMSSPFEIYQYFMDMSDSDALALIMVLSFRPFEELEAIRTDHAKHPDHQLVQRTIAYDVTALIHSLEDAKRSEEASKLLFGGEASKLLNDSSFSEKSLEDLKSVLEGSSMFKTVSTGTKLFDVIADQGNISKNAAKILIRQGGVSLNGHRITEPVHVLSEADFVSGLALLKHGKQSFTLLQLK